MSKFKYECNDDLIVLRGGVNYPEGAIVSVIDRSIDDPKTFLVISHIELGEAKGDINRMYSEMSHWVHQDMCVKINYDRSTFWQKLMKIFN